MVVFLGVLLMVLRFRSEGIHQFLFLKAASVEEKCYIFHSDSGDLMEESSLWVDGIVNYLTNSFSGGIYVEALPIPPEEADFRKENHTVVPLWGQLSVHYTGAKATRDAKGEWILESSRYTYRLLFYGPASKWVAVIVYDENDTYEVICAGSFEEAVERHDQFKAEFSYT